MYSPSSLTFSSSGSAASLSSTARAITSARRASAFRRATGGASRSVAVTPGDELGDRELRDAVLAERRQDVRDVLHEGAVRADDEHAAAGVLLALGVDQPRRAVQADRGLAGAGAALDHERPLGRAGDQAVLVGLDRRDDVAHVRVAAALELLEQEVAHAGAVERRAVERLVGDVEQPAALSPEAPAQRHALRILRRRRVERSRGGRLPVDDDLLALVVVHPAAADVERALDGLEVEAAEHAGRARRPRRSRAASPPTRRAPPARPRRRRRRRRAARRRACARGTRRRGRRTPARLPAPGGSRLRIYASRQVHLGDFVFQKHKRVRPAQPCGGRGACVSETQARSAREPSPSGAGDVSRRGAALGPRAHRRARGRAW